MKNWLTLLICMMCMCLSSWSQAKSIDINKDSTIILKGEITGRTWVDVGLALEKLFGTTEDVYLIINSLGGMLGPSAAIGTMLDVAKKKGIRTHCIVTNFAMSAAFRIFSHCTFRYAFAHSSLMFHAPFVIIPKDTAMTAQDLAAVTVQLQQQTDEWYTDLLEQLVPDSNKEKQVLMYFLNETILYPKQLNEISSGFVEVIDDVNGMEVFNDTTLVPSTAGKIQPEGTKFSPADIRDGRF